MSTMPIPTRIAALVVAIALAGALSPVAPAEAGRASLGPAAAANTPFTLEDVLSSPFPESLVAAKLADRIAWMANDRGARNVWTAAGPDFVPVNLTGFVRDEVFQIPEVAITDDGRTVVFVLGGRPNAAGWVTNSDSDPDGREQAVWAVRTDVERARPWRVAAGSGPVLSPDGRAALLVRDGAICRASLEPPPAPPAAGAASSAPEPEPLFRAAGRNGSPVWSPDGRRIAFVSNRDDHSLIGIYDLAGRRITWIAPSVDRDSDPRWSADGTRISFVRRPGLEFNADTQGPFRSRGPANLSIWLADPASGEAWELWRTPKDAPRVYAFSNFDMAANGRILFTAERENWNHVYSMPLAGGEPIDLTPGDGFVEHLSVSPDGTTLFYSSNLADLHGRHIWKVPTVGGKPVQLTRGATFGTYPTALPGGARAAFLYATAIQPTSVALVPPAGGGKAEAVEIVAPRQLPAEFPAKDLVTPQLVVVKAPDGLEVPCQLFLPKGAKPGDKRPAVVFTHGGPIRQMLLGWHYMEFYSEAYGINQYFASRGYVVISINYRSGIGYGRDFREAPGCGQEGAAEYQDVLAGASYLRGRPEVDPERVGAWGLSYGGLLTALSLARNSDIFKVGVDMAGVHDWSQMRWGRMDAARAKVARESSPVGSLATWTSPVLFIHGDDDRNVPFQQTVDLVQKLRAKGDVTIEMMIAPDEPHEFLLHRNRMEAYDRTFAFIDRFIGKKK